MTDRIRKSLSGDHTKLPLNLWIQLDTLAILDDPKAHALPHLQLLGDAGDLRRQIRSLRDLFPKILDAPPSFKDHLIRPR